LSLFIINYFKNIYDMKITQEKLEEYVRKAVTEAIVNEKGYLNEAWYDKVKGVFQNAGRALTGSAPAKNINQYSKDKDQYRAVNKANKKIDKGAQKLNQVITTQIAPILAKYGYNIEVKDLIDTLGQMAQTKQTAVNPDAKPQPQPNGNGGGNTPPPPPKPNGNGGGKSSGIMDSSGNYVDSQGRPVGGGR
jgi:hypothetical protein